MITMTMKQRFGQTIRGYRIERGLRQRDIAKYLNCSQSMISRIERGYDTINEQVYHQIGLQLGINLACFKNDYESIEGLIRRFVEAVMDLNHQSLNEIQDAFKPYHGTLPFTYDYLTMVMFGQYFSGDDNEAIRTLAILDGKADYIHLAIRPFYELLRFIYYKKNTATNQFPQSLPLPLLPNEALQTFLEAVNDYYDHYHPKALNGFLRAMTLFKRYAHARWQAHCEVYINKILMTDNDYGNLKVRTQSLLRRNETYLPRDQYSLTFQLAYSLYHLGEVEEALQLLQTLQSKTFEYADLVPYMIERCQKRLKEQPENNPPEPKERHALELLIEHYEANRKDSNYYRLIEQLIVPHLPIRLEINEYLTYAFDLLEYYGGKGNNEKYQELSQKMSILYRIL